MVLFEALYLSAVRTVPVARDGDWRDTRSHTVRE
jgi:hypothetical protein